ncbi:HlyD family efflux transporter periplasmic adaptor subunit [Spirulina major CS-329]|uniref:HlyD family efflux transporter periplasmic adaptor subunit n=1 Tax=Spirulina TaxID=1154 RepID=UPI00232DB86F|nr:MULTISPECIES: HlyD family efflux transporter periplasmic adaptor subunit [Spirulina]MDB9494430.1 HlyD family efflux transporter periplasmic adaptor subunit [Spirulina subsalsa CS-330]MDB9501557.1 HlyD family efflux transporter periplasmic adaptor subunit [Spirulina major CS-329]
MVQTAQQRYRTGIRWLLGSGAIALLSLGGGAWWVWRPTSTTVEVEVITVERGDVLKTVTAGGLVKVGNQQTLTAPTTANNTAIVERIEVSINSPIQNNQILMRLRNPDGLAQLEQKRLEITQKRSEVTTKQRDVQRAEVELLKAQRTQRSQADNLTALQQAELTLSNAQEELQRQAQGIPDLETDVQTTQDLVEQGYLAADELRRVEQELRDARSRLANQRRTVEDARLAVTNLRIERSQTLTDQQDTIQTQQLTLANNRQAVEVSLRELTVAQLNLQRDEESFANSSLIRATTDGRVLAIHAKTGDVLQQGDRLLTIGDPRREEVEVQLTTLQVPLIKTAQPATVEAIGTVSGTFPARVERVDRVAIASGESGSFGGGDDPGRVAAVIVLDRPSGTLIPGSQVSVTIEVEAERNVVAVPSLVVQGEGDSAYVWIVSEAGTAEKQPIEIGLQGDERTAILDGLEAGDRIISPSPDQSLTEGDRVKPRDTPPEEAP